MERRYFLTSAAAAAAAVAGKRLKAAPSDTVRVACVGLRGRGKDHIRGYSNVPNVEIVAMCDVDESVLNQRANDFAKDGRKKPQTYVDIRKLLENKEIDAISIATPNHSH